MCHRRIDVVPRPVTRAAHEPDPLFAEEHNVALAVAAKYHPLAARTPLALILRRFSTVVGKRRPPSLGDRQSLGGPGTFGDARVIALYDVACTTELVQLSILPPPLAVTASIRSAPLCRSIRSSIATRVGVNFRSLIGAVQVILRYEANICITYDRMSIPARKD
jgi:hypothetical protein